MDLNDTEILNNFNLIKKRFNLLKEPFIRNENLNNSIPIKNLSLNKNEVEVELTSIAKEKSTLILIELYTSIEHKQYLENEEEEEEDAEEKEESKNIIIKNKNIIKRKSNSTSDSSDDSADSDSIEESTKPSKQVTKISKEKMKLWRLDQLRMQDTDCMNHIVNMLKYM